MSQTGSADGSGAAQSDQTNATENAAQAQSSTQEQDRTAENEEPTIDPESSLQAVLERQEQQLVQIDEDGEQIKQVVGELVVSNAPHTQVTNELQQVLAGTLGELHQEEDAVGLPEIIFALWLELDRATGMLTEAKEQANAASAERAGPSEKAMDEGSDEQVSADCGGMFQ